MKSPSESAVSFFRTAFDNALIDAHPEDGRACYWLAHTLGRCYLYGELTTEDYRLPLAIAMTAARELQGHVGQAIASIDGFPKKCDEEDPIVAEELCFDAVETRHGLWMSFAAIEESCAPSGPLQSLLTDIQESLRRLDEAMQSPETFSLLSVVAESQLLKNHRAMLIGKYADRLPWWLDGRLDKECERVIAEGCVGQLA